MRTTGNPTLAQALADNIVRQSRRGLVAWFDMQTTSGGSNGAPGKTLVDLSGNGNNATFTATPNVTPQGISFNGGYWADFVLPAPMLGDYSFVCTVATSSSGGVICGSRNFPDQVGSALQGSAFGAVLTTGIGGNLATIPNSQDGGAHFIPIVAKVYAGGQGRGRVLGSGVMGYAGTVRPDGVADTRTRWRIGAGAQTNGSDHDAPYNPLDSGVIADFRLYDHLLSDDQEATIQDDLAAMLAPRGIVPLGI